MSIGVPVYNGSRFLAATLESILGQTYGDFELLISDNGSTDGTDRICRDFAERDGRVRCLRHDRNRGASWNYNVVVTETSGEYFKWASHDDLLAPTYLERCVQALDEPSGRVVLAYPKTRIIDDEGEALREYDDKLDLRQVTPHGRLRTLLRNLVLSNAAFGLMRRSALVRTRLLDAFPSADYVLLAELALLGQFHEVPERLFFRREHEGMSRRANTSPEEVAAWFAPETATAKKVHEFRRLLIEHLRSIGRMPLDRRERALCSAVFLETWLRRNGLFLLRETLGRKPIPG